MNVKEVNAQRERHQLVADFKKSLQSKEQELLLLIENQKGLHEVISKLKSRNELAIPERAFSELHGLLHWPVQGSITNSFGSLLDVGNQRLNGVVIAANENTPVKAIYSGKVIFANWLRGFGLLIIIHHNNNFMSLYGRNHTLLTRVGSHVHTGEIIATTGTSGGFEQSSLYFEIRQNGQPVNPNIWCS